MCASKPSILKMSNDLLSFDDPTDAGTKGKDMFVVSYEQIVVEYLQFTRKRRDLLTDKPMLTLKTSALQRLRSIPCPLPSTLGGNKYSPPVLDMIAVIHSVVVQLLKGGVAPVA